MTGRWAVGLVLLAGMAAPARADEPATPVTDDRVARCILENVALARSRAAAELVAQACEALIRQADSDPDDASLALVKCFVPGDPEWIEFRLLTRSQCAKAAGIAGG